MEEMQGNFLLMGLVWLLTGGVFNVWLLFALAKLIKGYKKATKNAINSGNALPNFFKYCPNKVDDFPSLVFFAIVINFVILIISVAWPIGLFLVIITVIVNAVRTAHSLASKTFFSEDSRVLRHLRKNPEALEKILKDKKHGYHEVALRLQTDGKLTLDIAAKTVEIDGKTYELKVKK